ncbi:Nse4 component of Smc5/6 DNA repair complex [Euphorbia peplus]|nr:Nse4 component of Smc5/6 DNA repair complex [Euphorbia peplus]
MAKKSTTKSDYTLRSRYQVVHDLIKDAGDDIGCPDSDKFGTIVDELDNLHKLVRTTRDQVVDAEAFSSFTNSFVACVKTHVNDGITPAIFVNSLLQEFGKEGRLRSKHGSRVSVEWRNIGIATSDIFRSCPGCCTMSGPMDAKLKQRKPCIRRHLPKYKRRKPKEIDRTSEEDRIDTDINMATVFDILRKKRSVKLENLILNRESFAQTVENLFALSFLVKDGRAEIRMDENGFHLVSPRNAPDASAVASGEAVYKHFVFRFDFKDWKVMLSSVKIGEELMPNRTRTPLPYNQDIGAAHSEEEEEEARPNTRSQNLSRDSGSVSQEEPIIEISLLKLMKRELICGL